MSELPAMPCPSCGKPVTGRFCGQCGEQRVTAHDHSIRHFAEHVFESLTHFDFKSLRAFKTLVVRPGLLTREYLDGRRRRYVGPIQLFVIANVLFALAGPNSFRTPLSVQEHDRPFPAFKQALVAQAIADRDLDREEFSRAFDEAAGLQAKTWVFAMIPALALVTAALYGFRRYYFEHLIFATHFYTFLLLWMLVATRLLAGGLALAGSRLTNPEFDTAVSSIIVVGLAGYLFGAFRAAFADKIAAAVARAAVVAAFIFPIVVAYRFLLFFVTLRMMH
jgi:hypothetical protein